MTNKLLPTLLAAVLAFTGTAAAQTANDELVPETAVPAVTEQLAIPPGPENRVTQPAAEIGPSPDASKTRATSVGSDDRVIPNVRDGRVSQFGPDGYVFPTAKKRFKRLLRKTVGPTALLGAGIGSTFQQIGEEPPEWEQNAEGFTRRFASNFGVNAIRQTSTFAISELMGQDPAYVKSGRTKLSKRAFHAIKSGFTARNRNGKTVFSPAKVVSPFVGSITAAKVWYPKRYSVQDGIRRGAYGLAFNVGFNLIREFVLKK